MSGFPKEDMLYDGDEMHWYGVSVYKATSGMPGHQTADQQTVSNAGPIPPGLYSLQLVIAGTAKIVNLAKSQLDTRQGIESLDNMVGPGGRLYNSPEWGHNRVRLNTIHINNPRARGRGGFYLHDSTKGYTHGCIEIEPRFFTRLRTMAADEGARKHGRESLVVKVNYPTASESTYGGTLVTP